MEIMSLLFGSNQTFIFGHFQGSYVCYDFIKGGNIFFLSGVGKWGKQEKTAYPFKGHIKELIKTDIQVQPGGHPALKITLVSEAISVQLGLCFRIVTALSFQKSS